VSGTAYSVWSLAPPLGLATPSGSLDTGLQSTGEGARCSGSSAPGINGGAEMPTRGLAGAGFRPQSRAQLRAAHLTPFSYNC
jgi:hypothetical protein